jgi:ABC-type sulfate/molybdate transport systems ATPase subunit
VSVAALDRVTFRRGPRSVLSDVSLAIEPGQRIGLVGPNGAGKSTLLRVLLALEAPATGTVVPCATGVGYVPQGYDESLFPWFSVLRNVAMPRLVARCADARERARSLCERVLPGVDVERLAGRLSGGEKQAVALARALAAPGDIVLADEPFSALATPVRAHVRRVLRDELRGRALVLVSHAAEDLSDLCERVVRIEEGRLLAVTGESP